MITEWYDLAMSRNAKQVVIGDRGRLVLPAEIRSELGIITGSRMLLSTETDGSLRLRPFGAVADRGRGMLKELVPEGESIVDNLVSERRAEAARENQR
jgi:AbrB family looped-hinge helix DNA binding protein